jgi:hypothetical protein
MVDYIQLASGLAGFGPAMTLLYYTLRDYTFPKVEKPFFDDKKLFAFFALGVVLGMIIFAFENWGRPYSSPETILVLIMGFAVMEELLKLIILNFPRFQRKIDTAFYGLSMGLGISATLTFATVYVFILNVGDVHVLEVVAVFFLGFLFVLLHGSTTALIGIGVARGDVKGYFMEALVIHILFALLYESFFLVEVFQEPLNMFGLMGAAAIVVWSYQKVHRLSLPVLIQDAKRLMQKKN